MNGTERLGILGGTFNPIHRGHLEMARQAKKLLSLDKVFLMVASDPPHKPIPEGVTCADRFRMAELACTDENGISACDLELSRPGKSYTCDTLEEIRSMYPDASVFLIVGSDSLHDFPGWRSPEKILKNATLVCLPREGISSDDRKYADRIAKEIGGNVLLMNAAIPAISSTMIRERFFSFRSCADLVDPRVETYMCAHGFYLPDDARHRVSALRNSLTRKRFLHSVRVVNLAMELAEKWGADGRKTFIAALLHDCAKELPPDEMNAYSMDESGILSVQHAFAGPYVAQKKYGIDDHEILEAIRLHCTGDENMGLIAKIVYLADATERERVYPGVQQYRRALTIGPDEAMRIVLKGSIKGLKHSGKRVHPASERALDQIGDICIRAQKRA